MTPPEGYDTGRHDPPDGAADHIAAIYGDRALDDPWPPLRAVEAPPDDEPPRPRPKIKRLRLLAILAGLSLLAAVSTVFGMLMAVASDLPAIDVLDVAQRQSRLVDRYGKDLGVLTGNQQRILVRSADIAPVMKHAIVAIEDRRFYTHSGVDLRGIARALYQDVVAQRAVQGGSTIAQQLVKNRLEAQADRTLFQKAREAAMAFHMTRKWDKERILRNYLNTIYFGNGAYGVESAAQTYFGKEWGVGTDHPLCGSSPGQRRCASLLEPQEAALIAGVVASPTGYDPIANPAAATARRNLVLARMTEQGYLTRAQYDAAIAEPIPTRDDIQPPKEKSKYPYFTTWVRQQVVDKIGAGRAFEGGLRIRTTLDSELQDAAQRAVNQWIPPGGGRPAVALVALDNATSEVRAMVGGDEGGYNDRPFNLATQGQRQPGSSFKPFTLAAALSQGVSPTSVWSSTKKTFCVTRRKGKCVETFEVNNYEDNYAGITTLANATAFSDNAVYAELGLKIGTEKIARLARRLGIRTRLSTNPAMTLGGLAEGVTPLDMAHAYQTFANHGRLTFGSLSPGADTFKDNARKGTVPGPVGIVEIQEPDGETAKLLNGDTALNKRDVRTRALKPGIAEQVQGLLQGVVRFGSGRRASLGDDVMVAGKTGTTENYGDAWFVGWNERYTVAVWVGYPDKLRSMEYPTFTFTNGDPVAGGTYPASIWSTFMKAAMAIFDRRHPKKDEGPTGPTGPTGPGVPGAPAAPAPTTSGGESTGAAPAQPAPQQDTAQNPEGPSRQEPAPAPQEQTPSEPAPQPTAPPSSGGTGAPPSGGQPPPDQGAGTQSAPAAENP